MCLSNLRHEALIGHIYIYWEAAQLSVFPELSSERNSTNLQKGERHKAHNDFRKNERAQSGKTHGKKKDDEKLGVVLRSSSTAVTQICTLAFIYWCLSQSWTWMVAFSKQEASVYSDQLLPTLLHLLSLPTPFFLPLSLHPFLLSISSSSSSQRSCSRKDELCCVWKHIYLAG